MSVTSLTNNNKGTTSTTGSSSSGSGLISAAGIGSGLDVATIVSKLMAAESKPLNLIKQQQSSYQTKLSSIGSLSAALSSFQQPLVTLSKPETFTNLSANSSNSAVVTATVNSNAASANYAINVAQVAQAQTISSEGQASTTKSIGTGENTTITFQFGSIEGNAVNGKFTDAKFTQDTQQATTSITINSGNNSLKGIATAINAANIGLQATIVGDGGAKPYHLVLNSLKTGANSALKISVDGDPEIQKLMSNDPAGTQNFTQTTAAQNANLTVNGIAITSASNTVTDAIEHVSLNVATTGTSTINVSANTTGIANTIKSFVSSLNALNDTIGQLTAFNSVTKQAGPMIGDPIIKSIRTQIQNALGHQASASSAKFTAGLAEIGISVEQNGTWVVNEKKLDTALNTNFKTVAALFSTTGNTTDGLTSFISGSNETKAGTYDVNITAIATQGELKGNLDPNSAPVTIAENTTIKVNLDGTSADIKLTAGKYTAKELSDLISTQINNDKTFSSQGLGVTTAIDKDGRLKIKSDSYGSTSKISISNVSGTSVSDIVGDSTVGSPGTNVEGKINGQTGVGNGQFLTGAKGTNTEGLTIQIEGTQIGDRGTVTFARGYANELNRIVTNHLSSNGTLKAQIKGINNQLTQLQARAASTQKHLDVTEKMYMTKFSTLDTILSGMQSKQSFLTSQIDVLNGQRNR